MGRWPEMGGSGNRSDGYQKIGKLVYEIAHAVGRYSPCHGWYILQYFDLQPELLLCALALGNIFDDAKPKWRCTVHGWNESDIGPHPKLKCHLCGNSASRFRNVAACLPRVLRPTAG